jgi:O-methyltransferase
MRASIGGAIKHFGLNLARRCFSKVLRNHAIQDLTDAEKSIVSRALPFTMTSVERLVSLVNAVDYLIRNDIPGDIAECGVWRGGSIMATALALIAAGDTSRTLYLYDTFEGMTDPSNKDTDFAGKSAISLLQKYRKGTDIWCYATLEEVQKNIYSTGYPRNKIKFIKGKVEDTLPSVRPEKLSLLRLDTDWYESTKVELEILYPVLHKNGILIIDDYGYWQGARQAVDEYFETRNIRVFLHRIDNTARIVVGGGAADANQI